MIKIEISGTKKDDPKSIASRLAQQFSLAGNIVRKYVDEGNLPDKIPNDANIVIIAREVKDHE